MTPIPYMMNGVIATTLTSNGSTFVDTIITSGSKTLVFLDGWWKGWVDGVPPEGWPFQWERIADFDSVPRLVRGNEFYHLDAETSPLDLRPSENEDEEDYAKLMRQEMDRDRSTYLLAFREALKLWNIPETDGADWVAQVEARKPFSLQEHFKARMTNRFVAVLGFNEGDSITDTIAIDVWRLAAHAGEYRFATQACTRWMGQPPTEFNRPLNPQDVLTFATQMVNSVPYEGGEWILLSAGKASGTLQELAALSLQSTVKT